MTCCTFFVSTFVPLNTLIHFIFPISCITVTWCYFCQGFARSLNFSVLTKTFPWTSRLSRLSSCGGTMILQSSLLTTCSGNYQKNYIEKVIESQHNYHLDKILGLQLPKSVSIIGYISYHNVKQKRQNLD